MQEERGRLHVHAQHQEGDAARERHDSNMTSRRLPLLWLRQKKDHLRLLRPNQPLSPLFGSLGRLHDDPFINR